MATNDMHAKGAGFRGDKESADLPRNLDQRSDPSPHTAGAKESDTGRLQVTDTATSGLEPEPLDSELREWDRERAEIDEAGDAQWMDEAVGRLRQRIPSELVGRQWSTGDLLGGRYRLAEKLGAGGFGVVYRAWDDVLNRDVAVKLLHPTYATLSKYQERFEQEARIASQIVSDHVVAVHTVERSDDGSYYLVMELIDGAPLNVSLGNLTAVPRTIGELILQAAQGLSAAHRLGVVHRDIKCSNLLVDNSGRLKLTDFGLARIVEGDAADATFTEQFAGTIPYMSPDQLVAPSHVDHRTDIYSLGVVLYELLADSRPFRGTPTAIMRQIAETDPTPLRQLNPSCPRDLALITDKCLRKDPAKRYQSADDLVEVLRCWMADRPVRARPIGRLERSWRWCRRNPVIAILGGVVIVAAIALAALNVKLSAERRRLARALNLTDQLLEGLEHQDFKNIDDVYARIIRGHQGLTRSEQLALRELLTAMVELQDAHSGASSLSPAASPRADFTETIGRPKWDITRLNARNLWAGMKVVSALNRLDRAIELDDSLGVAWLLRAQIRLDILDDPKEEVLPDWNHAVELLPNASAAFSGRGWCYLRLKRYEAAVADFKRAIEIDSTNELSHFGLAMALEIRGEFEAAITHYQTALQLPPKYMMDPTWKLRVAREASTAYWGASNDQFRSRQLDEAVHYALRALEYSPANQRPNLWSNLLLMTIVSDPSDYEELQAEIDKLRPLSTADSFDFAKDLSKAVASARANLRADKVVLQLIERIEADPQVASEISEQYLSFLREGIESEDFPQANRALLEQLIKALERIEAR